MQIVTFSIVSGGTVSDTPAIPAGYRLVGLNIPTVDSATLTISLSKDNSTFRATADNAGVASGVLGGAANTGDKFVSLPEGLSLMTEGHHVKITMGAAQSGGARTIYGICARTRGE